jgi:hypothetical protein
MGKLKITQYLVEMADLDYCEQFKNIIPRSITLLSRVVLEPRNVEKHRFIVRLISYLTKDFKENMICNPSIRLLVPIFEKDILWEVVSKTIKDVDLKVLCEHIKIMVNEEDEVRFCNSLILARQVLTRKP